MYVVQAHFRFYAELNDFLPPERRQVAFTHVFAGRVAVKDMIESLGVPHTEVELILVGEDDVRGPGAVPGAGARAGASRSVDFSYLVQDGDRISVYPVFESLDVAPVPRVRAEPLRHPRFVLDVHLGRLASYLRLLGFDTVYANDAADEELARIASADGRIVLTRDRGLLKRKEVTRGYCVRSTDAREQLREVVRRFDLAGLIDPFTRCVHCNGLLRDVPKEQVLDRLLPHTREEYDRFRMCESCGQVYWQGSHNRWLGPFIQSLREEKR